MEAAKVKMEETLEAAKVALPEIQVLQTLGRSSSHRQALYLVPAAENNGEAKVVISTGWPKEAQQGRWRAVAVYGANIGGSTVTAWLNRHERVLAAAAAGYLGEGCWDEPTASRLDALQTEDPFA